MHVLALAMLLREDVQQQQRAGVKQRDVHLRPRQPVRLSHGGNLHHKFERFNPPQQTAAKTECLSHREDDSRTSQFHSGCIVSLITEVWPQWGPHLDTQLLKPQGSGNGLQARLAQVQSARDLLEHAEVAASRLVLQLLQLLELHRGQDQLDQPQRL